MDDRDIQTEALNLLLYLSDGTDDLNNGARLPRNDDDTLTCQLSIQIGDKKLCYRIRFRFKVGVSAVSKYFRK